MKRLRILLIAALVAALAPQVLAFCQYCSATGVCTYEPSSGTYCDQHIDYCVEWGGCSGLVEAPSVASEWTIASVEIETPAGKRFEDKSQPVRIAELTVSQEEK
jgi:hypothetical protein